MLKWFNCCTKQLQSREIGNRASSSTFSNQRFSNFKLQEELDTRQRSQVNVIVASRDIVFTLTESGICAAFSRKTNKVLCGLNLTPDEFISHIFYNERNDSVFIVSREDPNDRLSEKFRSILVEYIRRRQPDAGFAVLETQLPKWRGLVFLDEVEGKVMVTLSAEDGTCKVFETKNYTQLYLIPDEGIQYVDIIEGRILLVFKKPPHGNHVPLKILSKNDGTTLKAIDHPCRRDHELWIEQLSDKYLLIQQETGIGSGRLQILDLTNGRITEISSRQYPRPIRFTCLPVQRLILIFCENRRTDVLNERGDRVSSLDDHYAWLPDSNITNLDATKDQEVIVSYCKANNAGCINISNVLSGKRLAKISGNDPNLVVASRNRPNATPVQSSIAEALGDVTSLMYDEERNEIFTGNAEGLVHVWSS